jgi:nucleoside 2-deoxyribosyltransferase
MPELKIYFAGSIRGGREFSDTYFKMIRMLQSFGRVFTEHVGDPDNSNRDDKSLSDREIHNRDMDWLMRSDLLVAEVSVPSLGVGYEIGRAIHLKKPVLCLYRKDTATRLSAMISGSNDLDRFEYNDLGEVRSVIERFIMNLSSGPEV